MKKKLTCPLAMRTRMSAAPFDQLSAFHWISIRRAGLAGQVRGRSAIKDDDAVARLGEVLKRERDAGIDDVEDRPHAPLVVPLPGDLEPYVDLVLVVSGEKLDRLAEHGRTEILDRHARYCDPAWPGKIGVGAGLIIHDADD